MNTISARLEQLISPPYIYYAIGTVVGLIVVLWLFAVWRRHNRAIIPFETEGGSVEIAPGTLRSIIQGAAASVPGVIKASSHHFPKRSGLAVRVSIHLSADSRLPEVETRIKQEIRNTLAEQFGMEDVKPIHIRVVRIIGNKSKKATTRTPEKLDPFEAALDNEDSK